MQKAKAIVLLSVSGLLLIAAIVLVITNWGYAWQMHLYTRPLPVKGGPCLLLSAVIGIGIWMVCRTCIPSGIRAVRASKQRQIAKATQKRLKAIESQDKS